MQLPAGFLFASYQPVPGWSARVTMEKLAQPVTSSHGEQATEQVAQITWTADSDKAGIGPGQFQDFPVSVQIPRRGRRHPDVQGAADLPGRGSGALDRGAGLR